MDNKDSEAEIHPLKTEDVKAQENHENSVERRIIIKPSSQLSRLSRWRTAAFFVSLFLCLIIVFAFSFIIPCPERPVSERTWLRNYDSAGELAVKTGWGWHGARHSVLVLQCSRCGKGLPSPCAFITAVSGTNGRVLWERPAATEVEWMQCGITQLGGAPGCLLVGQPVSLTAVDQQTGEVQWRQSDDFGANYTVLTPLSVIPDVDGDGVQDLIIFIATGDKVGHCEVMLSPVTWAGHGRNAACFSPAVCRGSSQRPLIPCLTSLGKKKSLKESLPKQRPPRTSVPSLGSIIHVLFLFSTGDIRYLAKIPGRSRENILVVSSEMTTLISAQNLQTLWTLNVSRPLLGYYKPDVLDVVLESEIGPNRKKGGSGAVQWDLKLNSRAESPQPATLSTADHRSTFLIWGEYQVAGNETVSSLYLFHPSYTNVLLELRNSTDQIIAFNATLFERSRHACYVLLRGPQPGEEPGLVSLMKRKLKEDVSESRVIWLSQVAVDSEQYIRDRLYRMRYHSRREAL
uniref:Family with sequence similarity 234 member A n=1 Tax=Coturnix japonica TaxID=93934 RepID=A0A8C2U2X1_COTJA